MNRKQKEFRTDMMIFSFLITAIIIIIYLIIVGS